MVLKQLARQDVLDLMATQFILLCEPAWLVPIWSEAAYWRSYSMAYFFRRDGIIPRMRLFAAVEG
jgi:hypothetical protein